MLAFNFFDKLLNNPFAIGSTDGQHLFIEAGLPSVHLSFHPGYIILNLRFFGKSCKLVIQIKQQIGMSITDNLSPKELPEMRKSLYPDRLSGRKFVYNRSIVADKT